MRVNWNRMSQGLQTAMLVHELRLPDCPIGDGRWHECDGGQYLMFPNIPIAIFRGGGEDSSPIVWQHEPRLLTLALEQRIADAIARRPVVQRQRNSSILQARDAHGSSQHATTPAIDKTASSRHDGRASEPTSCDVPSEPVSPDTPCDRNLAAQPVDQEALRMFDVRPGSAVARAMEALAEWLATGPVRTIEIKERAKQAGFSWATMRRAADGLPVCALRAGWGGAGSWWWGRSRWR